MTSEILPCELALVVLQHDADLNLLIGDRISHIWGFERVANPGAFGAYGDLLPSMTVRQAQDPPAEVSGLYMRMVEVAVGSAAIDGTSHLDVQKAAQRARQVLSGTVNTPYPSWYSESFTDLSGRPAVQMQFQFMGGGALDARLDMIAEYTTMLFSTGLTY